MEFFKSAFERIKILVRLKTRNVKRNFEKKEKKKKTWKRNRKSNETRELKKQLWKWSLKESETWKNWTEPRRESKTENYWIESYFEIVNSGF